MKSAIKAKLVADFLFRWCHFPIVQLPQIFSPVAVSNSSPHKGLAPDRDRTHKPEKQELAA